MSNTMEHRRAIMTPKPDKIEAVRELLVTCEKQISLKMSEGGPVIWFAAFDETTNQFYVESIFANEEALAFHQNNIGPILQDLPPLLTAPLETTIHAVFTIAK